MGQQSKMFINEECVNKMWCIHPMMYLVSQSCPSLCDPRTVTTGLLCPWGFSRQEYWSRLSCPPPGEFPNPGIKPRSPTLQVDCLPADPQGKPKNTGVGCRSLLQGIFRTQGSNLSLLHWQADSLLLSTREALILG